MEVEEKTPPVSRHCYISAADKQKKDTIQHSGMEQSRKKTQCLQSQTEHYVIIRISSIISLQSGGFEHHKVNITASG